MARPLGRLVAATLVLLGCLGAVVGMGQGATAGRGATAFADTPGCLPPPTLIYSEVAQVAGTDSQVWADLQQVEQNDAAAGTSGSGQVVEDMLGVIVQDGYQWNCSTGHLEAAPPPSSIPATPGIPTISNTPIGAAPASTSTSVPASSSGQAGPGAATTASAGSSTSTTAPEVTAPPATAPPAPAALAAGKASTSSSGTHAPLVLLAVLVLISVALIVFVVYRQLSRR